MARSAPISMKMMIGIRRMLRGSNPAGAGELEKASWMRTAMKMAAVTMARPRSPCTTWRTTPELTWAESAADPGS